MDPPLRRRRARPACSWQSRRQKQVILVCACLGLGARTIAPAEAWVVPATAPSLQRASLGRDGGGATRMAAAGSAAVCWRGPITSATPQGAFSCRPTPVAGSSSSRLGMGKRREGCRRGAWGAGADGEATRYAVTAVVGSRSSSLSSRGGRRRAARPLMSMAEEDGGGAERAANNAVLGALAVAGLGAIYYGLHDHGGGGGAHAASFESIWETARAGPSAATAAAQAFLTSSITRVEELGPLGPLYFGALYVLAEVLIVPALPLTAAAGFLFGVAGGTAVVLSSATIAAAISFQLGRTLLRQQVEGLLDENPKFRALDTVIGKEGFKIILLLRLSPIFPFALSNYLYGVTSVDFLEYMAGTMIGFFPGTLAYVYGGTLGKALSDGGVGGGLNLPWYGYVAGAAFLAFLLKTVGEIAKEAIEEMEPGVRDE